MDPQKRVDISDAIFVVLWTIVARCFFRSNYIIANDIDHIFGY